MTLSKILLTLGVAFSLTQKARSLEQAALICENGGVYGQMANYMLFPCHSASPLCAYEISAVDYTFPGFQWDSFDFSAMYHIYCDDTTSMTGICYYSAGNYYFTDSFCTNGYEAVMLLTVDYQRRRHLRQEDGAFDGPELDVEIDGQMMTLLNPRFHET